MKEWPLVPLRAIYRRIELRGRDDLPLLSLYRDHGVVLRDERDDNNNRPGDDLSTYKYVKPGDLVVNKMKTWQGSVAVSGYEGIVSPAYFVGRRVADVHDRFMHHLLRSPPMIAQYGARSKGIRPSQWDLPWDEFVSIKVAIPSLGEQRAIADYLDVETARIDALIAKRQQMMSLVRERLESWADAVLWEPADLIPLRHVVAQLTVGIVVQPASYYVDPGAPGAVPAVRAVDLEPFTIRTDDLVWISAEGNALHGKSQLRAGDVVVVRTGKAGAASVVPPPLAGANCISNVIIRCSSRLDPWFLEAVLNSRRAQQVIDAESVGAIQQHFGVEAARRLPLPDLDLAEQRARARLVAEERARVAALTRAFAQQEDLLRERRQALITAAVTGELDIPGAAA